MATSEEIKKEVTKLVEDALRDNVVAGIESDIQAALQTAEQTITMLTEKLSELEKTSVDRVAALEALERKNEELNLEAAAKSDEVTKLVEANKALMERAEKAEAELNTVKKDILVKDRMSVLDSLKIARSGEARDKQTAQIREMSDEDFAAYKDDMLALRAEFLSSSTSPTAQCSQGSEVVAETVIEATPAIEESNVSDETAVVEDSGTPPADVSSALEEASTTLVNAETASVDSKWVEYRNRFSTGLTKLIESTRGTEKEIR